MYGPTSVVTRQTQPKHRHHCGPAKLQPNLHIRCFNEKALFKRTARSNTMKKYIPRAIADRIIEKQAIRGQRISETQDTLFDSQGYNNEESNDGGNKSHTSSAG